MFLVRVQEPKEPFPERLRRRLKGKCLTEEEVRFEGCRAVLLHWYGPPGRIPWRRITAFSARPLPLLLPEGAVPPPGVQAAFPEEYAARLTVSAAVQCLKAAGPAARRGTVGILDPAGRALWAAAELCPVSAALTVYTLRPARWERLAGELMEEAGVPVLTAGRPSDLKNTVLTVAPYPTGVFRVPAPVFAAERCPVQGAPTVNRFQPDFPPELLEKVPPGVPVLPFIGLAEERGPGRNLHDFPIKAMRIGGRAVHFRECVGELLRTP